MSTEMVEMLLRVSPTFENILQELSEKMHVSQGDVLRKSMALMKIAFDSKQQGNHIGIVNNGNKVIEEIAGI